ncbi:MAG: hypothetical protein Q9174_003154 [Haloplaca sp. 1 TL-2023]
MQCPSPLCVLLRGPLDAVEQKLEKDAQARGGEAEQAIDVAEEFPAESENSAGEAKESEGEAEDAPGVVEESATHAEDSVGEVEQSASEVEQPMRRRTTPKKKPASDSLSTTTRMITALRKITLTRLLPPVIQPRLGADT